MKSLYISLKECGTEGLGKNHLYLKIMKKIAPLLKGEINEKSPCIIPNAFSLINLALPLREDLSSCMIVDATCTVFKQHEHLFTNLHNY
jgi:hypothetical protein